MSEFRLALASDSKILRWLRQIKSGMRRVSKLSNELQLVAFLIFASVGLVWSWHRIVTYYFRSRDWKKCEGIVLNCKGKLYSDNNYLYELLVQYSEGCEQIAVKVNAGHLHIKSGDKVLLICDKNNALNCQLVDAYENIWTPLAISSVLLILIFRILMIASP